MKKPLYEPLGKQMTDHIDAIWQDGFFTGVSGTLLTLATFSVVVYFWLGN